MKVYRLNWRRIRKYLQFIVTVSVVTTITFLLFFRQSNPDSTVALKHGEESNLKTPLEKVNWNNEEFERKEKGKTGNGEHGKVATLPPNYDRKQFEDLYKANGYNGMLSDFISINRSIPDLRPVGCRNMTYRRHLPQASFILPLHNEHWSTLLRTVYSILNRSPENLVKEILIVDDGSTKSFLKKQLDDYVATHFTKVHVIHMDPPRKGLMAARSLGAQRSTGEVLIFMDAHCEVNIGWLPPLLEPIAENYKTCVCPILHGIHHETFEISEHITEGGRGMFNWEFLYKVLPLFPEDKKDPTKPYKNPVMMGALFAISSRFFWELGGYDPELKIWGGEQYELSFKIWQCGGTLIDHPCSRAAHMFRGKYSPFENPHLGDFVGRNYKRVAEIWMDEYAEFLYKRKPHYRALDPGDLSEQKAIRERLKCKPFKWFMEEIAFDLVSRYPGVEPPDYAWGRIKPLNDNHLCLTATTEVGTHILLEECFTPVNDKRKQEYIFKWSKDIQIRGTDKCVDKMDFTIPSVSVNTCHMGMGNQLWRYDSITKRILFSRDGHMCLSYDIGRRSVNLEKCDEKSKEQKWIIEQVNEEALKKWAETLPLVNR